MFIVLAFFSLRVAVNGITSPVKFDLSKGGCHLTEKFTP